MSKKIPLVHKEMILPFILVTTCFAAWGVAANMTDPLVKVFGKIFTMSTLQSTLVQFSYYGAYFCLALPAAMINKRFSYKVGILSGLGCAALGALMFYPASLSMTYGFFLAALFVLAGGLSILETSANPYVMLMGPRENATRRLNFAQSFNPVGTNMGVFLATAFILPRLHPATELERAAMDGAALKEVQAAELAAVMAPYVGMACGLILIWIAIALTRAPDTQEEGGVAGLEAGGSIRRLFAIPHYRFGVIAQFFYVAAQVCVWTFTIQFVVEALSTDEVEGGRYLQYSLIVFLIARFIMTWLMGFVNAVQMLLVASLVGSGLCFFAMGNANIFGIWAVVMVSACMSLMFPTIYGMALKGLEGDTKFGAAGLVMAILGGALVPLIQGAFIDGYSAAISYIVPGLCFLIVAVYAYSSIRH